MLHKTRAYARAALLVGASFAAVVTMSDAAGAHEGHGRLAGQADVTRIGREVHRYDAARGVYSVERAGRATMYYHADPIRVNAGAAYQLPTQEDTPNCVAGGHRIVPVWHHAPGADGAAVAQIRSIVRRMNWKIKAQSEASSTGLRSLEMNVECNGGEIAVREVVSSSNESNAIRNEVESTLGAPSGATSVKFLIFRDEGPRENAAGVGWMYNDARKSASDDYPTANANRYWTSSAVVWKPYWTTHTSVHELVHVMGGSQPGAPLATAGNHCYDGHDLLCYNDAPGSRVDDPPYTESTCPSNGWNETPTGVPLDCNWDTYFDALTEPGEWLAANWNLGGHENAFLAEDRPRRPAVVVKPNGERQLYYRGDTGQLEAWRWDGRSWSHTTWDHAGNMAGDPTAVLTPSGRVEVFYRLANGQLRRFWFDGPNWNPTAWDYPGNVAGDPAAVVTPSGRVEVFYRLANGQLRRFWFEDPNWNPTASEYPGSVAGDPTVGLTPSGRLEVFYRFSNGQLRRFWFEDPNWNPTSSDYVGSVAGDPAVAVTASGRSEVFYRLANGQLRRFWFEDPNWNPTSWDGIGQVVGDPAAAVTPSGRVETAYRTADGRLRRFWFEDPNWNPTTNGAASSVLGDPAIAIVPGGHEVYFAAPGGGFRYWSFTGAAPSLHDVG